MTRVEPVLRVGHDKAEFEYWEDFLPKIKADELFTTMVDEVPWQEQSIMMYGKKTPMPRLTHWYGDEGAAYRYSGVVNLPSPWSPQLAALRSQLVGFVGAPFNSVLLNFYRSGADSLGWHSDDEPELGGEPIIASVSLGGDRRFDVREVKDSGVKFQLTLGSGSLLIMRRGAQRQWRHSIPKVKQAEPRINLTFRNIAVASPQGALL